MSAETHNMFTSSIYNPNLVKLKVKRFRESIQHIQQIKNQNKKFKYRTIRLLRNKKIENRKYEYSQALLIVLTETTSYC